MQRPNISLTILTFTFVGWVTLAAAATTPPAQPAGQGQPGQADHPAPAVTSVPRIDVNAAELAEGKQGAIPAKRAEGEAALSRPGDVRTPTNPLAPRFQAILDQERQQLQELQQQAERTTDTATALQIQQQARAIKMATERRLLEVQLEAARRSGDQERIAALERAVASLDAPRPAPVPVDRPIPDVHQH